MSVTVLQAIDARAARRWALVALAALGEAREQIDAVNVFPIADGDTGTNLYLTLESAAGAVAALPGEAPLRDVAEAFARGALLGARGNSGVIAAQLLQGWADVLAERGVLDAEAARLAADRADRAAWEAVAEPVEGTMLSVSRAAARAAAEAGPELADVVRAMAAEARRALAATPGQLELLRRAHVVDAGGQGLVLLIDALAEVVLGAGTRRNRSYRLPRLVGALDPTALDPTALDPTALDPAAPDPTALVPAALVPAALDPAALDPAAPDPTALVPAALVPAAPHPAAPDPAAPDPAIACPDPAAAGRPGGSDDHAGDPGYEVMYLLEALDAEVRELRRELVRLGTSVVVVGGGGLWHVHVHLDDAGAAIEAGLAVGRPRQIRVTHLALAHRDAHLPPRAERPSASDAHPAERDAHQAVRGAQPAVQDGHLSTHDGHVSAHGGLRYAHDGHPADVARQSAASRLPGRDAWDAGRPAAVGTGPSPAPLTAPTRLVACAAGPGLAEVFTAAGAVVVEAGPGRRPDTTTLLDAFRGSGPAPVVVLPNDPQTQLVAEAAAAVARREGIRVTVLPTRAQVQGLAAVAVHDPARGLDDDVVRMSSAAAAARDGAVTVASRDAMTTAGPCRAGDALGVVQGDFVIVGSELAEVARQVLDRLLSGGGELVTVVTGRHADPDLVRAAAEHARRARLDVEVTVLEGGQERYPLLLGVE